MDDLWSIVSYVLPSVVVFVTAYFLLKEFFRNEQSRRHMNLMAERMRISLPLRLQAYERLVIFLERISPNSLIARVHRQGLTVREFQLQLLKVVRDEYSHNLSQQVYVSAKAWELTAGACEEIIAQVNALAASLDDKADSGMLSRKLLEAELAKSATREAIDFLKSEARKSF
ncbi:MAG: hypothetical protein RG741_02120 [Bacteroidales bacterium]|nr:hypothetical protein [Bacteroidales bacterium]